MLNRCTALVATVLGVTSCSGANFTTSPASAGGGGASSRQADATGGHGGYDPGNAQDASADTSAADAVSEETAETGPRGLEDRSAGEDAASSDDGSDAPSNGTSDRADALADGTLGSNDAGPTSDDATPFVDAESEASVLDAPVDSPTSPGCNATSTTWACTNGAACACCPAETPYYCSDALRPCWAAPVDCATLTHCDDGQVGACSVPKTYRCEMGECRCPNLLTDGSLDTDSSSWTQASTPQAHALIQASSHPATPPNVAVLGGENKQEDTLSQIVQVPANFPGGTLSFLYRIETEEDTCTECDHVSVEVTDTGVETSLYQLNAVATSTWKRIALPVPETWAGHTFKLAFVLVTDAEALTTFTLDTISLTADTCGP